MEASVSRLDIAYRKILISKFFTKGWGKHDDILTLYNLRKEISDREKCYSLVSRNHPIQIINRQVRADYEVIEGKFESPFSRIVPNIVPRESRQAYFQMVLPLKWRTEHKPVCIHLASTGDHYFWRRRNLMAKPLLKNGIGSVIMESPYYGLRKPRDQIRSRLHYVSDIIVMGGCIILECIAIMNWCETIGLGPLGVTGVSMGGHMASLVASNWPKPLVLVPCLSWSTASSVFTEGVLSDSIDWDMLQKQYISNKAFYNKLSKLCKIVDPFIFTLHTEEELKVYRLNPALKSKRGNTSNYELLNMVHTMILRRHREYSGKHKTTLPLRSSKWEKKNRNSEAVHFMRSLMDEYTHLKNFSVPFDTSLIIAVCANSDGYIPRLGVSRLEDIWPGITVRYINTGHVGACLWHRKIFQECIVEAFARAEKKLLPPRISLANIRYV